VRAAPPAGAMNVRNAAPLAIAFILATIGPAAAENVSFTTKPTAVRDGDQVKITFTVSAPTDVEVTVLAADGKAVRHLAAGALGRNAPEPLKKDALAQDVTWDGRDDLRLPAAGGPFRIRVSIGAQPKLERHLGWDGHTLGSAVVGLTVGKGGEVYVLESDSGWGLCALRVLDRAGKYLRTILPYPASTPRERAAPLGQLEVEGERIPIVFSGHGGNLAPLTAGMKHQRMVSHPKGYLLLASAVGTIAEHGPPRHLLALHPEGGAPEGVGFIGPQIRKAVGFMGGSGERDARFFDHLAVSPDGEWIYLVPCKLADKSPRHAVYRLKWADKEIGRAHV